MTTEWRTPPQGRHRKYNAITDEGLSALAEQQRQWTTVTSALNDAWKRFDIQPITALKKKECSTMMVGRAHAARLADKGHAVMMGTRDRGPVFTGPCSP